MSAKRRPVLIVLMAAAVSVAALCGLTACSSQHQVITSTNECLKCHEAKETYEVSDPKGATEVGTTFTVKVSDSSVTSVMACKPIFIDQDGTKCVPLTGNSFKVSDGKAEVTLEEGVYAIDIPGDGNSKYKIVKVSSSSSNTEMSL